MIKRKVVQVPGREIGMTVPMAPAVPMTPAVEPKAEPACEPNIKGLYWFEDGEYAATEQGALLNMVNDVLAVAKVVGEICGDEIEWSAVWENIEGGDSGPPIVTPDGQILLIEANTDTDPVTGLPADTVTVPGTLVVQATIDGSAYGPITLTLYGSLG